MSCRARLYAAPDNARRTTGTRVGWRTARTGPAGTTWDTSIPSCWPCSATPTRPASRKPSPLAGVAHQNGTLRFGDDPTTSVLDRHCKAHDVDNLYVVDASFFPSSAAVNPALTIIANALRVGDHLLERLN